MRGLALASIALATAAVAAPRVEIRARTQLTLQGVRLVSDGDVEVDGELTDKLTGDALAGQRVRITLGDQVVAAFTQADGTFHAELPAGPGPAQVRLDYPGGDRLDAATPLQVTADPSKTPVELALTRDGDAPGGARIRITATSDRGSLQIPVELAIAPIGDDHFRKLVTITSGGEQVVARATAGGPGLYRVRATFAGDATRQKATTEAALELASQTTTTMQLASTRVAYDGELVATGVVTDEDHRPVAHAAVTLSAGDKRLAQGATGIDGRYRLEVEAEVIGRGDIAVQTAADPGSSYLKPSRAAPQHVSIGAPHPVPVSYTIVAFAATLLAAGGFFVARSKPWRRLRRPPTPAQAADDDAPAADATTGGLVLAKPGIVSTLRRASDDGFAGVVRDSVRGRPVADAVVRLVLGDTERELRTGADGAFAHEGLPAGEWRAEVAASGHVTEAFGVTIPHRGELRGVRVDLVPVRERVFQLYRRAAEPVLPAPRLWGIWTPRQIVDHVRARRPSPALAELTDFVEEVYFSPRLAAETVLPQAAERVDRAIHERAGRGI